MVPDEPIDLLNALIELEDRFKKVIPRSSEPAQYHLKTGLEYIMNATQEVTRVVE